MRAFLGLPVLALVTAVPVHANSIRGKVEVPRASCVAAKLIPRTAEAEREIVATFGTTEGSALTLDRVSFDQPPRERGRSLGREVQCSGPTQVFRFSDVPPGEYFITVLAREMLVKRNTQAFGRHVGGHSEIKFNLTYFMEPVRVTAADGRPWPVLVVAPRLAAAYATGVAR